jgi:hypothetical protein
MTTAADKGRLELLLDDFTKVHGTVLMGMHKELNTLKADVEKQVAKQITETLKQIEKADARLKTRMEKAERTMQRLEERLSQYQAVLKEFKELGVDRVVSNALAAKRPTPGKPRVKSAKTPPMPPSQTNSSVSSLLAALQAGKPGKVD